MLQQVRLVYEPITIFILAPGAFFVLAALSALQNKFKIGAAKRGIDPSNPDCGGSCAACGNTMCKGKRGVMDYERTFDHTCKLSDCK